MCASEGMCANERKVVCASEGFAETERERQSVGRYLNMKETSMIRERQAGKQIDNHRQIEGKENREKAARRETETKIDRQIELD